MNPKGARDMEKHGELLFNGQSIEKALNDLLFSKSEPQVYKPEPAQKSIRDQLADRIEKKIARLRYLMHRTRKRRKKVKLAWRVATLCEIADTRKEVAG
jgi:ubiquinone biosynthesis protein COQ9